MVHKFFQNIKSLEKGITLIEIAVVIVIIALFSAILISNFPAIQRQYALSRATYKLAQDLRKVQDLGLSGVKVADNNTTDNIISDGGNQFVQAKGYGIFIDARNQPALNYILYADTCAADSRYSLNTTCSYGGHDYIIETVNVNEDNSGVFISQLKTGNGTAGFTSIDFSPPNPYINIENLANQANSMEIVLALISDPSATRSVSVNTFGLIEVK